MKRNVLYRAVCVYISILLGLTACVDDEIRPFDDVPEGETIIDARVNFKALTPALATRAVAGDAIKEIETLWVLAYDASGELKHIFTGDDLLNKQTDYVNHSEENVAESKTPQVKFQLKIPYGVYRMYAVANVNLSQYEPEIKTIAGLKGIAFKWSNDVAKNNQMFGYFTPEGVLSDDTETIRIDRRGAVFQARIRRLASKVTVAFDGTMLHDGVYVYIKSAEIRDIPTSCLLGNANSVTSEEGLMEIGDTIQYAKPGTAYNESYPVRITKGRPYYPCNDAYEKNFHGETERALFFYENMQGTGKDKKQNPAEMGKKVKGDKGYKDDKPYGTYIEVKAYYISKNPDKMGMGEIIYRFMLGKDIIQDFNAERNHHYKLTLKFKNYANDVDWHIEYEEKKPEIFVPDVYYISPLYNHSMMLPIKVNAGDYTLVKLEAQIDTNSWAPWQGANKDYYYQMDPYKTKGVLKNHTGFLSLRRNTDRIFAGPRETLYAYSNNYMDEDLRTYYNNNQQGSRVYYNGTVTEGESGTEADGKYIARKGEEENVWNFQLPMYTRAKQLIIKSGYTGSNPYELYQRRSVVKFTATLKAPDGTIETISKRCPVVQERRMVNPTGIWRKHDNAKSFHVELKCLNASESAFIPFTSEGKWRAFRLVGDAAVSVTGANMVKDTVWGSTGSHVDFNINFSGAIGAKENRFAIIQVDYHDYSCQHLIFVRQGEEPVAMVNGGVRWYTWNMRTRSEFATSPCEEGSLFRWGTDDPIDVTSNFDDGFQPNASTKFSIAGGGTKTWDNITRATGANFSLPTLGNNIRVANYDDFYALYKVENGLDNGYGVLYGNEATETQGEEKGAYGYTRYSDPKYGMRGCFVYDIRDGKHIFFPIGASGYGRRQHNSGGKKAVLRYGGPTVALGTNTSEKAPLLWDLYRRKGAIYWLRTCVKGYKGNKTDGWDFNYFSFDFNLIDKKEWNGNDGKEENATNTLDAAFLRAVRID
ncbi:MAG: hypothetical protein K2I90_08360 [Odoribacter sp.]|nr:hypothetical protein [Odoribacter sp.]